MCQIVFYVKWYRPDIVGHMSSHGEKPFRCNWPGCGKHFVTTAVRKLHQLFFDHLRHRCDSCGKSFWGIDALNLHRECLFVTINVSLIDHLPVRSGGGQACQKARYKTQANTIISKARSNRHNHTSSGRTLVFENA